MPAPAPATGSGRAPAPRGRRPSRCCAPRASRTRPTRRCRAGPAGHGATSSSPREPVLDESPHGGKAVTPGDLLALVVAPTVVADGQLVDAEAAPADLGRQLGLDPEVRLA